MSERKTVTHSRRWSPELSEGCQWPDAFGDCTCEPLCHCGKRPHAAIHMPPMGAPRGKAWGHLYRPMQQMHDARDDPEVILSNYKTQYLLNLMRELEAPFCIDDVVRRAVIALCKQTLR